MHKSFWLLGFLILSTSACRSVSPGAISKGPASAPTTAAAPVETAIRIAPDEEAPIVLGSSGFVREDTVGGVQVPVSQRPLITYHGLSD